MVLEQSSGWYLQEDAKMGGGERGEGRGEGGEGRREKGRGRSDARMDKVGGGAGASRISGGASRVESAPMSGAGKGAR